MTQVDPQGDLRVDDASQIAGAVHGGSGCPWWAGQCLLFIVSAEYERLNDGNTSVSENTCDIWTWQICSLLPEPFCFLTFDALLS